LNVDDISGKLEVLKTLGVRLVDQEPREGLSGRIAFVHPSSVFGVLTELVESQA
jgi:methylmalonyl-CoA/ethylmalonyl-CoA epimerase